MNVKTLLKRHWTALWWLFSAGLIFGLGCLARLLIKEPPFTDWAYIVGMAIGIPSVLLPVFLHLLRQNR